MAILVCGYGLIGRKRVEALIESGVEASQIHIFDPFIPNLKNDLLGSIVLDDLESVSLSKYSRAIVAIPHQFAVSTVVKLLDLGLKVLMEKPMGRNLLEVRALAEHKNSSNLSIGFNYRFMPGIVKLKHLIEINEFGDLYSIRIDLGHGGKPEDTVSWKLDPEIAGGGVILDPGIHVMDLLHFIFLNQIEFVNVEKTVTWSGFWNTGIEEIAFVVGKINDIIFNLNLSIVSWKTKFFFEVIGSEGYAILNGRGRSDGPQTLALGKRWGWISGQSQSSSEQIVVQEKEDRSIFLETVAWLNGEDAVANSQDGLKSEILRQEILSVNSK